MERKENRSVRIGGVVGRETMGEGGEGLTMVDINYDTKQEHLTAKHFKQSILNFVIS